MSRSFSSRAQVLVRVMALVFFVAAGAGSRDAPASERVPVDSRALFTQACVKCHGAEDTGGLPTVVNGPKPIDLGNPEWQRSRSDGEIAAAIRDGRGAMPPFADVLTADQIGALAAHVRTLAQH